MTQPPFPPATVDYPSLVPQQAGAAPALPMHVAVAGAAGGVGTTTVTALLIGAMEALGGHAVRAVDHSGGSLVHRIATTAPTAGHAVSDLGTQVGITPAALTYSGTRLVVVTSSGPGGADDALRILQRLDLLPDHPASPSGAHPHVVLIVDQVSPRRPPQTTAATLHHMIPDMPVIALAWDSVLVQLGPVDMTHVSAATVQTVTKLLDELMR